MVNSPTTFGRRNALKAMGGAALVAVGSSGISFIRPGSAEAMMLNSSPGAGTDTVIVTVFLRGAADGLNMVVPVGDSDYHGLRPTIGLDNSASGGAIDIDGFFSFDRGFHHGGTGKLFATGKLAVVHASGSHAPTRSHFSAMANMDSALAPAGSGGWLERALVASTTPTPSTAYGIGSYPNPSLIGANGARPTVPSIAAIGDRRQIGKWRRSNIIALHNSDPWFANTTASGFLSTDTIMGMTPPTYAGYPSSGDFQGLADAAAIINADVGVRAVTIDLGGFDHHQDLATRLPPMLAALGQALNQFWRDLVRTGADQRVVTVVQSEFGRTAKENGSQGTDHGHGNCMLVLGQNVQGGQVYLRNNEWPGLGPTGLYEGQDLAVTTDFRDVYAEVLAAQFGAGAVAPALPGHQPTGVGLFGRPAPTITMAAPGFRAYNAADAEIQLAWSGDAPSDATGTIIEVQQPDGSWNRHGWFTELTSSFHGIYKSRPNQPIDRNQVYGVRVAWRDASGEPMAWSETVTAGPWVAARVRTRGR